jgi:hypothetical protein
VDRAGARSGHGARVVIEEGPAPQAAPTGPTRTPHATRAPSAATPPARHRPFVGRDELVNAAVDAAIQGTGTVFHGIAGNGKSRVVEAVVELLEEHGCRTAMLHCRVAGPTMPLGAVAPLLPDARRSGSSI